MFMSPQRVICGQNNRQEGWYAYELPRELNQGLTWHLKFGENIGLLQMDLNDELDRYDMLPLAPQPRLTWLHSDAGKRGQHDLHPDLGERLVRKTKASGQDVHDST